MVVAAQENGPGIGRIRMRHIVDASASLMPFVQDSVAPGSVIHSHSFASNKASSIVRNFDCFCDLEGRASIDVEMHSRIVAVLKGNHGAMVIAIHKSHTSAATNCQYEALSCFLRMLSQPSL